VERKTEKMAGRDPESRDLGTGKGHSRLLELEPEIRAAAILDRDGGVLECTTSGPPDFGSAAADVVDVIDAAGSKPVDSCHIASPDAEVFVVREGDLALVAVTERFVLASLMAFDMRMTLRDLAGGHKVA
jgi:hypothetical protein